MHCVALCIFPDVLAYLFSCLSFHLICFILALQNCGSSLVYYRRSQYLVQGELDTFGSARSSTIPGKPYRVCFRHVCVPLIYHFHQVKRRTATEFLRLFPFTICLQTIFIASSSAPLTFPPSFFPFSSYFLYIIIVA